MPRPPAASRDAPSSDKQTASIMALARRLSRKVARLSFSPPVTHVYNPLAYAWAPHEMYLRRFSGGTKEVVFVGMNPGPFGMAQTGVPFGEVALVRDWMGISGLVRKPKVENPKRPVSGFACTRSEVSGTRLWGWARDRFGSPAAFFDRFFVANHCPLVFMEASGRNVTPDKLQAQERLQLEEICDQALYDLFKIMNPRLLVGVGAFATKRARLALQRGGVPTAAIEACVGTILHPSPASPAANRGWAPQAEKQLEALGVKLP